MKTCLACEAPLTVTKWEISKLLKGESRRCSENCGYQSDWTYDGTVPGAVEVRGMTVIRSHAVDNGPVNCLRNPGGLN